MKIEMWSHSYLGGDFVSHWHPCVIPLVTYVHTALIQDGGNLKCFLKIYFKKQDKTILKGNLYNFKSPFQTDTLIFSAHIVLTYSFNYETSENTASQE